MNDRAQVALLGGHQRETFRQIEAHLMAEQGDGTGAGTVRLDGALIEDFLHQVEISSHYFASLMALPNNCGRL